MTRGAGVDQLLLTALAPTSTIPGTHTIDMRQQEDFRALLPALGGGGGVREAVALIAAAHVGERRVTLVLMCNGKFAAIDGGESQSGVSGLCGSRVAFGTPRAHHVSEITAIKQSPLGADGSCTLSVAMTRVEELVLSVTGPAANAFAQHVCSIRALAAGEGAPAEAGAQPCGVPAGLTIEGLDVGTLTAPQTPDTKAALLIGASINKRTSQLPEQLINFVTQLCEKGLLDLGAAGPDAQSLVPPLTGQLQQGEPDLKVVKISSNDQLEQFSSILASAATVTKISMKNAGISAHALDNFVENSVMQGGCSQCSELSLAGNPELANATLGAKFSSWPLLPVLNLNFGTPVYSTQGALTKLVLDGCKLPHAAAASVMEGLMFHLSSLSGISMAEGIAGPAESSGVFFAALGNLLAKSKLLSVLVLSDCNLDLQYFPTLTQAPLQVLNLTGNRITQSAANFNEFIRSAKRTLQLVSIRSLSVPGPLSPTLCEDMAAVPCVIDVSGLKCDDFLAVSLSAQTLVMRDFGQAQLTMATSAGVGCLDLDLRTRPNSPGFKPAPALFSSPSLTSLSLAKCNLGSSLTAAISSMGQQLTLSSLDVSHNGSQGLIGALVTNLAGNRSLTSLKVAGNSPSNEEILALGKFFGGVNKDSGVLWGNKTLVMLDIPSEDFERDVQTVMQPMLAMVKQGQQDMQAGQRTIKSAYKPNYRNPNKTKKAQGIAQKVKGKKTVAAAEKFMGKLKRIVGEISDALKRNQSIMSLKEQSKIVDGAARNVAKLTNKIDSQKEKYKTMVAANRAKRLSAWDQVPPMFRPSSYASWRSEYGATFDSNGWELLKADLTEQHLEKASVQKLTAKTEAEIANEARHKEEIELKLKQLKQLQAIAATPPKPAYDPAQATTLSPTTGQYELSPELQKKNTGAWQNNKVVQKAQKTKSYKSRGNNKYQYKNRYDEYGYYWYPGYYPYYYYGYGYGFHPYYGYGYYDDYYYYDSYSSDDYWSDWSSDDWDDDGHDHDYHYDDYPVAIEQDTGDVELDIEIEDAELQDLADVEEAVPVDDGDDDADAETVEMYASAGPQRWWKGDGGGAGPGSMAQRAPPPRRRSSAKKPFDNWLDQFWQTETKAIFNECVLGRRDPESLPFKVESFRCADDDPKPALSENAVTLVTQCSVDRMPQLEAQARGWNGPMSVAIYVQEPETDLPAIAALHERLIATCSSLSMEITLVHSLPDAAGDGGGGEEFSEYDRLYPINTLRNIATDHARTDLLFLLDVDFVPCRKLKKLISTELWTKAVGSRARAGELTVIPAFEITPDVAMPSEQAEVLAQVAAGSAEAFHVGRFPAGHQPTDFNRWASATARYEVDYRECFEPYVIGSRSSLPRYDERFKGYGMNKVQHLYACHSRGLRFVVEPQVFVAAAEHERSEAWRIMYGPQAIDATDQQQQQKDKKARKARKAKDEEEEHSVRVSMVWSRFKEELAKGQAPDRMATIDSEHVLKRRELCPAPAKVNAAAAAAGAATRTRRGAAAAIRRSKAASISSAGASSSVVQKKKAQQQLQTNAKIEKMVTLVGRLSNVTV